MVVDSIHNSRPQTSKGYNHRKSWEEISIHGSQEIGLRHSRMDCFRSRIAYFSGPWRPIRFTMSISGDNKFSHEIPDSQDCALLKERGDALWVEKMPHYQIKTSGKCLYLRSRRYFQYLTIFKWPKQHIPFWIFENRIAFNEGTRWLNDRTSKKRRITCDIYGTKIQIL